MTETNRSILHFAFIIFAAFFVTFLQSPGFAFSEDCGGCHGGKDMSYCTGCHYTDCSNGANEIDLSAIESSVHRNLNCNAYSEGYGGHNSLDYVCRACQGDGTEEYYFGGLHPSDIQPKICEDCHLSGAFDAPLINNHRYGASFTEVTQTLSVSYPVTGSCLRCHNQSNGAVLLNSDDDSGSILDADGDGTKGGSGSYHHYGDYPELNGSDSENCLFCHGDAVNGASRG